MRTHGQRYEGCICFFAAFTAEELGFAKDRLEGAFRCGLSLAMMLVCFRGTVENPSDCSLSNPGDSSAVEPACARSKKARLGLWTYIEVVPNRWTS